MNQDIELQGEDTPASRLPDNSDLSIYNQTPPTWSVPLAFINWGASIAFAVLVPLLLIAIYGGMVNPDVFRDLSSGNLTMPVMMLQLVGTFGGQILSLILCWMIVTGYGAHSFNNALGMSWSDRIRLPQTLLLGAVMFVLSVTLTALLPHQETDMDKFLKFGLLVRITLALVATVGAPIHEEIVYRGVLYTALERSIGKRSSVVIVSLMFWMVHVVQYRESLATLVAVLLLSFALTYLRAWSGKLLPCIATHLVFNGIQGIIIVVAPEKALTQEPAAQTALQFIAEFFRQCMAIQ